MSCFIFIVLICILLQILAIRLTNCEIQICLLIQNKFPEAKYKDIGIYDQSNSENIDNFPISFANTDIDFESTLLQNVNNSKSILKPVNIRKHCFSLLFTIYIKITFSSHSSNTSILAPSIIYYIENSSFGYLENVMFIVNILIVNKKYSNNFEEIEVISQLSNILDVVEKKNEEEDEDQDNDLKQKTKITAPVIFKIFSFHNFDNFQNLVRWGFICYFCKNLNKMGSIIWFNGSFPVTMDLKHFYGKKTKDSKYEPQVPIYLISPINGEASSFYNPKCWLETYEPKPKECFPSHIILNIISTKLHINTSIINTGNI